VLRLPVVLFEGIIAPYFVGFTDTAKAGKMVGRAYADYGKRIANAFKIDMGLFQGDSNLSPKKNFLSVMSRFSWEIMQTTFGNIMAHVLNNFYETNVEYFHGATMVSITSPNVGHWGITTGPYINGASLTADPVLDDIFAHEYGHTKQSQFLGPLYLPGVGVPSLVGSFLDYELDVDHDHDREWYEVWANQLSYNYFDKHGYTNVTSSWNDTSNPRTQNLDWYFYLTLVYYVNVLCHLL